MTSRRFDCVEMKRRGAEHVYSITKDMTPEEEVEFWRRQTEELRQEQQRLQAEHGVQPAPTRTEK